MIIENKKTLILMRHGHYDKGTMSLSSTGLLEAYNTAQKLNREDLIPDAILHSPVKRAVETAHRLREVFNKVTGRDIQLVEVNALKETNPTSAIELLKELNDEKNIILAITHAPNICGLSMELTCETLSPVTAEALVYQSPVKEWIDLDYNVELVKTITPKA